MAHREAVILADRRMLKRALPSFGLGPNDAAALARHMVQYALAGLEAVARDVRKDTLQFDFDVIAWRTAGAGEGITSIRP